MKAPLLRWCTVAHGPFARREVGAFRVNGRGQRVKSPAGNGRHETLLRLNG